MSRRNIIAGTQAGAVLVAENNPCLLPSLVALLEDMGFSVEAACSASEALNSIQRRVFDIILTDMRMERPDSGLEVISASKRRSPSTRVFVVSGDPQASAYYGEAKNRGAEGVLDKDNALEEQLREGLVDNASAKSDELPVPNSRAFQVGLAEIFMWLSGSLILLWGAWRLAESVPRLVGWDYLLVSGLAVISGIILIMEGFALSRMPDPESSKRQSL